MEQKVAAFAKDAAQALGDMPRQGRLWLPLRAKKEAGLEMFAYERSWSLSSHALFQRDKGQKK